MPCRGSKTEVAKKHLLLPPHPSAFCFLSQAAAWPVASDTAALFPTSSIAPHCYLGHQVTINAVLVSPSGGLPCERRGVKLCRCLRLTSRLGITASLGGSPVLTGLQSSTSTSSPTCATRARLNSSSLSFSPVRCPPLHLPCLPSCSLFFCAL
jgi:hypothetical protein